MHRGVYAVGHANVSVEAVFLAAVKACGAGAVLSHYAAAAHWGMVEWDDRYPSVTAPRARVHPGVRVHRGALTDLDVTRHRTIPITTPARTLVDLSSVLPYQALRRAARNARSLRLVSLPWITEALERAGSRRGTSNLRQILATGLPPTRSELEDAVLELIVAGGLRTPDVNVPMRIGGRRVIPDFRWPEQRLVIEADGAEWHDDRIAREDDVDRQALLEAHGERVVRVTWDQATRKRGQTLTRLTAAGAPKLPGQ
jgi:very-short-patch-repair endonuclease